MPVPSRLPSNLSISADGVHAPVDTERQITVVPTECSSGWRASILA